MRINKFVALSSSLSRRAADTAIMQGRVCINGHVANVGDEADETTEVTLDEQVLQLPSQTITILFHKPIGYVCSRDGQGSHTIYELLPAQYQSLQTVGRLDKESSGILLLTNDGQLAYQLTHPKFHKEKMYEVTLDKPLKTQDQHTINDTGVTLEDGQSVLSLRQLQDNARQWQVRMSEGRNRQIRRTFAALGYTVKQLHRLQFGDYLLDTLPEGQYKLITNLET